MSPYLNVSKQSAFDKYKYAYCIKKHIGKYYNFVFYLNVTMSTQNKIFVVCAQFAFRALSKKRQSGDKPLIPFIMFGECIVEQ